MRLMRSKRTKEFLAQRGAASESNTDPNGASRPEEETFTIGQLAAEFDVSPRTLRFYEQKGLLKPRREGAQRLYDARDRARLALVQQGKRLAFTLAEIRDMVAAQDRHHEEPAAPGDDRALDVSRERCLEQINLLERQKRGIETALAELRRIYSSFYAKAVTATGANR